VGKFPADATAVDSTAFASPKSSTFTTPSGVTLTFAGFRSRWMMSHAPPPELRRSAGHSR
jgi:hypothetical protein